MDHETADPTLALAAAIDEHFTFSALADVEPKRPVLLVGPPGCGKTITVAKLCARHRLNGSAVRAISTDTHRAGGFEQLAAFTRILQIDLHRAETSTALTAALATDGRPEACFIDTAGANPYSQTDMEMLYGLAESAGVEPVLVFPAGLDPLEAADVARAYADLGVERMIVTKVDMVRRAGSVLSAADAAKLTYAEVSFGPQVAEGLASLNPMSLARLITPSAREYDNETEKAEAAL